MRPSQSESPTFVTPKSEPQHPNQASGDPPREVLHGAVLVLRGQAGASVVSFLKGHFRVSCAVSDPPSLVPCMPTSGPMLETLKDRVSEGLPLPTTFPIPSGTQPGVPEAMAFHHGGGPGFNSFHLAGVS